MEKKKEKELKQFLLPLRKIEEKQGKNKETSITATIYILHGQNIY